MNDGKQRSLRLRSMRGLAVLAAATALGTGMLAAGVPAASASTTGHIDGGVEDGTFSPVCLQSTATTPDTGVLSAASYRNPIGNVVRILVPWNIADTPASTQYQCLSNYLATAKTDGVPVEVSLNRVTDSAPGPQISKYTTAVQLLVKYLGPDITYLSAWNEPNNKHYLNNGGWATLAGDYYAAADAAFPHQMIAGDFSSEAVSAANLSAYIAAGGVRSTAIWSVHPYSDVRHFENLMLTPGETPQAAGATAAAGSTVTQLANELAADNYGTGTRIWIGEIFAYDAYQGTSFPAPIPADAAQFLSGGLGPDSLSGYLKGKAVPQVGRYIYLRADDAGTNDSGGQHVLQVNSPDDCVYGALTSTAQAGC